MAKTLVIAPSGKNLVYSDVEVSHLVENLHPDRLLQGRFSLSELIRSLDSLESVDYIFFIGHANAQGLELSDEFLDNAQVIRLFKKLDPKLIFLNSCDTLTLAVNLYSEIPGVTIIGTRTEVIDQSALLTGLHFAEALARGRSFAQAYEESRPKNDESAGYYFILDAKHSAAVDRSASEGTPDQVFFDVMIETHKLMRDELAGMKREVYDLRRSVDLYQKRPVSRTRRLNFLVGYLLFLTGVLINTPVVEQYLTLTNSLLPWALVNVLVFASAYGAIAVAANLFIINPEELEGDRKFDVYYRR